MQLYPILLVAVIALADGGLVLAHEQRPLHGWPVAALTILPMALLAAASASVVAWCLRRRRGRVGAVLLAGRVMGWSRWLLLACFAAAVMALGWLDLVRDVIGDLVLLDELICLAPAVAGLLLLWWVHYPVERRLREALLIRRLDTGQPIYPVPSRLEYVLLQSRCGLLLLLVPILCILALAELIDIAARRYGPPDLSPWALDAGKFAAAVLVFVVSPLIVRRVLSVRPLPEGATRRLLLGVCRRHRVRVRQILVWDTYGSIINAAVMGLVGPLRYVLMTDALLESMSESEVEAVMAHEVAHVRRHHMPWLVVTLLAAVSAAVILLTLPLWGAQSIGLLPPDWVLPLWVESALVGAELVLAMVVFGWVSRRFERQADTFAVQHLSGLNAPEPGDGPEVGDAGEPTITAEAVRSMQAALSRIAQLNTIDPEQRSWRHGSIAWRQRYLATIVGQPTRRLGIDGVVRWIKWITAIVLAATIAAQLLLPIEPPAEPAVSTVILRPEPGP